MSLYLIIFPCLQMASVLPSDEEEDEVESYNSGEHSGYLISNMEQFRVDAGFTDITIEVEGRRFACHKVILAAGSPYFRWVHSSPFMFTRLSICVLCLSNS